jgi:hypothetical protein
VSGVRHEVAATGFVAVQRVDAHQLGEVDEIRDAARFFEFLVELCRAAGNQEVVVELLADFPNAVDRIGEFVSAPVDAALLVEQVAELAMEVIGGPAAADVEQMRNAGLHAIHGGGDRGLIDGERLCAQ